MCKTTDIERRAELKAAFLEALNGTMGLVMAACDKVGVHRNTILSWRKADPEFDAAVTDVQERQVDYVENNLLRLIQDGDTSATIFYLKTKGKKRGYIETIENQINTNAFQDLMQKLDDEEEKKK